jgi:hypothetical protein
MSVELVQVELHVDVGEGADARELEEATRLLRRQLLQLDVAAVGPVVAGPAPDDTRAVELMVLGSMLVTLTKSPELLKALMGTIQAWLGARQGRSVELQIDGDALKVSGISSDQQQQLIALFVERHSA